MTMPSWNRVLALKTDTLERGVFENLEPNMNGTTDSLGSAPDPKGLLLRQKWR